MLQGWIVIAIALGYIGLLFVVASYGDRLRKIARGDRSRLLIYPLCLAIYCTSWTFFGSVGLASKSGFDFLTIYVGPILMIGLCTPLVLRIVRLAKSQNITSIADFIAARYGKRQSVAALVALIAIVGTIPYIALQLKAVSAMFGTVFQHVSPGFAPNALGDTALLVALAMAAFAILFGTRHIDATEHQDGLMLAIATELHRQTRCLSGGRAVRDLLDVRRPGRPVLARDEQARYCRGADHGAEFLHRDRNDAALDGRDHPVAAAVPCHGRGEPFGSGDQARRLALPALSRADQPVCRADRTRRPAHLPSRQGGQRHVRAGTSAIGRCVVLHDRCLHWRSVGRDRDGDRGIGRARHHGVERPRDADLPETAVGAGDRQVRRRRTFAPHPQDRYFCHSGACLSLLPVGRRRAACGDRPSLFRGRGAACAGLFRRAVLAAGHRARRYCRSDGRDCCVVLHTPVCRAQSAAGW